MLLIDGYNLLYKNPNLIDDRALIQQIIKLSEQQNRRCVIVFDGKWDYSGEFDTNLVCVEYVENADSRIMELVVMYQNAIVISSDNEIAKFARNNKARVIKSENFLFAFDDNEIHDDGANINVFVSDDDVLQYLDFIKKN